MNIRRIFAGILKRIHLFIYFLTDSVFLRLDRNQIRRTRNIRLIPAQKFRRGGKRAYSEWAHVIGIFQTLISQNLPDTQSVRILDVGCGTGILGIASEPFLGKKGLYTGIDIIEKDINFCRSHFDPSLFHFHLIDAGNAAYNPGVPGKKKWPLKNNDYNLVTALSVWTHFDEDDAVFYIREVSRILKPGGRAIITFFVLNDRYKNWIDRSDKQTNRFHMTAPGRWIFDQPVKNSSNWFSPEWAVVPENAIGITENGIKLLKEKSGLKLISLMNGNWKGIPGIYFQDVIIFEKPGR